MKRWALRIFLFLLLGAIVNVAVAWGMFLSEADRGISLVHMDSNHSRAIWYRFGNPDANVFYVNTAFDFRSGRFSSFASVDARDSYAHVFETQSGWPAWSFVGQSWDSPRSYHGLFNLRRFRLARVTDQWSTHADTLPCFPLWPGFAINTVFYAGVLWLLFAGPFVVRRWRRIRRGLCPKCAYDLRGTPEATACPECGATR